MECSTSRAKLGGLLAAALLLLGACYVCVFLHRGLVATIASWFGFLFFGLVLIKIVWDLLRPGPRVIINENGIEDRRLGIGLVTWNEITAIELRWMGRAKFLCVEVRNPDRYVSAMPLHIRLFVWANGLLGYPPITITFAGLSPGIQEVWEYINTHHPPPAPAATEVRKASDDGGEDWPKGPGRTC